MNFLDNAIAWFSPRTGAERLYYRSLLAPGKRAYDAAKRDRNTDGWVTTGSSANAEIYPALSTIRQRSRDLVRNNPFAASAVRKITTNIVGTGIKPRPAAADKGNKDDLAANWAAFVAASDPEGLTSFYGQVALALDCVIQSGEALIRWNEAPSKARSPIQCEVLEPDFLDMLKTEQLPNGAVIIQGVEYDRSGHRVAYWLFDRHPGEMSLIRTSSLISKRYSADTISHVFDRRRPGQVRGVPWFAPVAIPMRDVDDYEFAARLTKKIAACYSVFIQRDLSFDTVPLGVTELERVGDTTTGRILEKVAPGTINYLRPGETPTIASPPQDAGYAEYMIMQLHAIAAGLGIPYHVLTGDLRQANYSSLREGKLDFWSLIDVWQQFMVIPQLCSVAWDRVHAANARRGGPAQWAPALWQVPKRPWVDPKAESEAEDLEFQNGTKTWVQALHERGLDEEEQLATLEAIMPRLEALGIDLLGKRQPAKGNPNNAPAQPADVAQAA